MNDAGLGVLVAELDQVSYQQVRKAISAECDRLWRDDGGRDGPPDEVRTPTQRRAEAFTSLLSGPKSNGPTACGCSSASSQISNACEATIRRALLRLSAVRHSPERLGAADVHLNNHAHDLRRQGTAALGRERQEVPDSSADQGDHRSRPALHRMRCRPRTM
ncbi:MAG: hypothetical protein F4125_01890 [Acidimicrobiaceae bacterium]|nr:hypothetical protein [Acidimicrobiaceae bacterium]